MVKIAFVHFDGREEVVDADEGISVMEAAITSGVDGIDADCGGQLSCATCHVHVAPEWQRQLPAMSTDENDLLDFAIGRNDRSRLCCQLKCTPDLDGLRVHVPETQR